jgi:hypothetical protein
MSDTPEPDHAAPFRRVADKIDTNRTNGFAGAFVIVPPVGEPQDMLLLDSRENANPVIFWSTLKTRVDIALAELDEAERRGGFNPGGGRR